MAHILVWYRKYQNKYFLNFQMAPDPKKMAPSP